MSETIPNYGDNDAQNSIAVRFDPGPTGLLLLDVSDHFKDLADSVHLEIIASYLSLTPTVTDRTFDRILDRAEKDSEQVLVRRIRYESPLEIVLTVDASIVSASVAFGRIISLHNRWMENRRNYQDHQLRRRLHSIQNQHLDEVTNGTGLSPKQRKKLEDKLASERRMIRNILDINPLQ